MPTPKHRPVDNDVPVLDTNDGEYLKIHKKDIQPIADMNHEHVYKPDGEEDNADWYSVKCIVSGCIQGRLIRKFSIAKK